MPVRFIIGRAGSGKSRYCLDSIVEMMRAQPLGPPIYLIVPKQATFSAERELTCGSGLAGFCRARVVSFELLGEQVLAECGGTAVPEVTELGRQMMLGHLLRKHEKELKYYGSTARRVGLAAALDGAFAELERSGRGTVDLENLVSSLKHDSDDPSLVQKLSDLRLLYSNYLNYLGSERLDPHRRLEQVLLGLERCTQLRGASIFVDGFLEFHDWQRKMVVGMSRLANDVQITLLMDPGSPTLRDIHRLPDELELFHRTELTYRQMWFALSEAGTPPEPPERLREVRGFSNPSLKQIEKYLLSQRPVVCGTAEGIEMIEAPDRRAEVDAAAREVKRLAAQGMRYRDIAVLVRDLGEYHELIDASFHEHGIPSFADRRRSAAHHPLLQFTRATLQLTTGDWNREAVMALLKSELAGFSRDEVDELEEYVLEHRIRGGSTWMDPKPWSFARKLTRGREDEPAEAETPDFVQLDALRRKVADLLSDLVALFGGYEPLSARQITRELFNTFERFGIRQTLSRWIRESEAAGRLEERDEHHQVWSELTSLLDQMVDVIGDEPLMPEDFITILETGLEQFDLALTPPTVDQVLVGQVDRTRNIRPRAVILLGMNDHQFPRTSSEDSILADSERKVLKKHRLELGPDSQRNLLDERLLGYIAFTRAAEKLTVIRAIADSENRPQSPSPFWLALLKQFPTLRPKQIPRQSDSLEAISTPRQLVTHLMHWARNGASDAPQAAIYQWLATHHTEHTPLQNIIHQAWPALVYQNQPKLGPEAAREMFRSPLRCSVSQIETFASCAFKHFAGYGLRLQPRQEEAVTVIDMGVVCHSILERIITEMFKDHQDWTAHTPEQQEKLIAALADQVGKEIRGELLVSGGRNQYILGHIRKTVAQVMDAQSASGKRSRFIPWRTELPFGESTKLGPLVLNTPAGNEIRLKGKIDRVDKVRNELAFAVIDYKYSGDRLALHKILHGLSLQLLTYLLVLQENGSKLLNRQLTPVAALYVQLLRQIQSVKHPDEAEPPVGIEGHMQFRPRGLIDVSKASYLDGELDADAGTLGPLYTKTDACTAEQFAALLKLAKRKLAELGDQLLAGAIDVAPYRIGQESPCIRCDYRSVCRFDPAINSYRRLPILKRDEVLEMALGPVK